MLLKSIPKYIYNRYNLLNNIFYGVPRLSNEINESIILIIIINVNISNMKIFALNF